jgi:serine/threonine protein kinase
MACRLKEGMHAVVNDSWCGGVPGTAAPIQTCAGGAIGLVRVARNPGVVVKFFDHELHDLLVYHGVTELATCQYLMGVDGGVAAADVVRVGQRRSCVDVGVGTHCLHLQRGVPLPVVVGRARGGLWDRACLKVLRSLDEPQERVALAQGLCVAATVLWDYGLAHCDLKPGNVVVHVPPQCVASGVPPLVLPEFATLPWATLVRVIDFGSCMTQVHRLLGVMNTGTRPYMSPEVFLGAWAAHVPGFHPCKVDLWSLGVVALDVLVPAAVRSPAKDWQWWPFVDTRARSCGYEYMMDLFRCLGTPAWATGATGLPYMPQWPRRTLASRPQLQALLPPEVLQQLDCMLDPDPATRSLALDSKGQGWWTPKQRTQLQAIRAAACARKVAALGTLPLWTAPVAASADGAAGAAGAAGADVLAVRRAIVEWLTGFCADMSLVTCVGLAIMLLDSWLHAYLCTGEPAPATLVCKGAPSAGLWIPVPCLACGGVWVGPRPTAGGDGHKATGRFALLAGTMALACIQVAARYVLQVPLVRGVPFHSGAEACLVATAAVPALPALLLACPAMDTLVAFDKGLLKVTYVDRSGAPEDRPAVKVFRSDGGGDDVFDMEQPTWTNVWAAHGTVTPRAVEFVMLKFGEFAAATPLWERGGTQADCVAAFWVSLYPSKTPARARDLFVSNQSS